METDIHVSWVLLFDVELKHHADWTHKIVIRRGSKPSKKKSLALRSSAVIHDATQVMLRNAITPPAPDKYNNAFGIVGGFSFVFLPQCIKQE